jgi:hypothetical protein
VLFEDLYKLKVLTFSFINTKKECHFTDLTQGREEHVKNIKLNWRRRTTIFVVNYKQKLILIIHETEIISISAISEVEIVEIISVLSLKRSDGRN